jgi:hypothetical protein
MSDLHNAIMNIPAVPPEGANINQVMSYKIGHRDARHAAAELALATHAGAAAEPSDAEVADFVTGLVGNWRDYSRDVVLKVVKAALTSAPAEPSALRSEIAYMAAYDLDELDGMSKDRLLMRARDLINRARHALATLAAAPPQTPQVAMHADLMRFYAVDSIDALIAAQVGHIEKLQSKLQPAPSFAPQRVREG